ncbi:MAG: MBL fold metallo-hydrolase [Clostridiales bacterium]|uniref:MBL fold metallo-hydrolase n=1 Tax=Clostridium sp. N3C TaxID=1776758 RepID=UPI00092E17B1|nr:MBL fold metallo-hydrolase [Clostridium sp. N3C]NLZ49600.1 MBL fold metallo-hydrolase [Clostridiales bacterium]SCN21501.1 putative polyketide biosynthesis zinc-dependent hydrolase PksB [Clostridium sp. N3C]
MKVLRIPAGPLETNCYIVIDEDSKETAIIDPGGDEERLTAALEENQAKPKYILLTHGHFDHTGAVVALKNKYKVPVYVTKEDYDLIHFNNNELFYMEDYDGSLKDFITEDTVFELGRNKITCIKTPGHTPGGVCFYVDGMLFSGDTLFYRSIGRTDFYGGDYRTLVNSIKTKLMVLPNNTTVLPGHGEETTIGEEEQYNPFF